MKHGSQDLSGLGPFVSSYLHSLLMFYAALNLPQKKRGWSHLLLASYFWFQDFWLLLFYRIIMVPSDIFPICSAE